MGVPPQIEFIRLLNAHRRRYGDDAAVAPGRLDDVIRRLRERVENDDVPPPRGGGTGMRLAA